MASNNLKDLLNFSELTPNIKSHLNQVYGTLSIACLSATAGCIIVPASMVQGFAFLIFGIIATIGLVITMHAKRGNKDHGTKFLCLLAIAFIDGASLKPLISIAEEIDPMIILNALIYTATIFISFSVASLITKRRSMLFLGGFLSSILLAVFFGGLLQMVFGFYIFSNLGYNVLMLVVFSFYVIYDTQVIVEKAARGDYDYTLHALELFIDLIRIFVHILRILIELNSDKKKK